MENGAGSRERGLQLVENICRQIKTSGMATWLRLVCDTVALRQRGRPGMLGTGRKIMARSRFNRVSCRGLEILFHSAVVCIKVRA